MKTTLNGYLHCPLCGFEFEKHTSPCATSCPLGKFCNLICCPNCRYEFAETPQRWRWLERLFGRRRQPEAVRCGTVGLHELEEGQHSELVCLSCTHASRRNALAVYGLIPGSRLLLQQKRPAFVVRVGETELALEADIAREILVKPLRTEP